MKGKLLLATGLAIYMTGCAALTPSHQNISITTNVPDAIIMVNNENVGLGSAQASVKRNKQLKILQPINRDIFRHIQVSANTIMSKGF